MKLEGNPDELVAFVALLKSAVLPNTAYLKAPIPDDAPACDGDCDECFGLYTEDELDAMHEAGKQHSDDEKWREAIQTLLDLLNDED